jgi:nitrogen fixation protein NifU and related proteins
MDEMYRENILDHGMNPRNSGVVDDPTIDYEVSNPLCGDHLRLTLKVNKDDIVVDVGWDGAGCAVSQAAASMLGEEIIGKNVEEVKDITKEDVYEMLGIPISQNRVKCAMLGLKAVQVSLHGIDYWRKLDESDEE